ncbi:MAG: permease prefix domain 1-containing protein [Wenzhouxiangellaceae bacterium]|nr:permease prefix domain 1-containing protein [Wenzhouxiangellaceae bacterium]
MSGPNPSLDAEIGQWREFLRRRQAIHAVDIDELEDHLRAQIDGLIETGLDEDEAFLVAVKRIGQLDAVSREFARVHSERLWKQLVIAGDDTASLPKDAAVAFALAVVAALLVKAPMLFGWSFETHEMAYARNAGLFVLPLLAGYFLWKRTAWASLNRLTASFVTGLLVINLYPFADASDTGVLAVLHLPVALWLLVGIAHAGGRWGDVCGRMNFVRFSGELAIYYALIALGGGVLIGFMMMLFQAIGIDAEPFLQNWLLPCGAAGAVLVAAWLVEAKQSVIENMAPVLTRLFTPMFALLLIAFLIALVVTGRGLDMERELLIGFDLLLIVVLGLLLYAISARDPMQSAGWFDIAQITLLLAALAIDLVALSAMLARIGEMGLTPNRVAALGLNFVLLVNLAESARRYLAFQRGQRPFADLERWQTGYLPVYALWAAFVVAVLPLLFGFR